MLICPRCDVPLCRIACEGLTVHLGPDCLGGLVRADRLERIRAKARPSAAPGPDERPTEEVRVPAAGAVLCPRCLRRMESVPVSLDDVTFALDFCGPCGLVWLDGGELERLASAASPALGGSADGARAGWADCDAVVRQLASRAGGECGAPAPRPVTGLHGLAEDEGMEESAAGLSSAGKVVWVALDVLAQLLG